MLSLAEAEEAEAEETAAGMTLMADSAEEAVSEGGECCREDELDAAADSYLGGKRSREWGRRIQHRKERETKQQLDTAWLLPAWL